jgi:hypothetical protein
MERAFGHQPAFFWVREWQRRGAPHFHLAGAFPATIHDTPIEQRLSLAWYQIVASDDERHLRAGTRIDWSHGLAASGPNRLAACFSAARPVRARRKATRSTNTTRQPGGATTTAPPDATEATAASPSSGPMYPSSSRSNASSDGTSQRRSGPSAPRAASATGPDPSPDAGDPPLPRRPGCWLHPPHQRRTGTRCCHRQSNLTTSGGSPMATRPTPPTPLAAAPVTRQERTGP